MGSRIAPPSRVATNSPPTDNRCRVLLQNLIDCDRIICVDIGMVFGDETLAASDRAATIAVGRRNWNTPGSGDQRRCNL